VAELSRGVPRLINVLCDRALLGAYVEEKEQVDLRIVNQAACEVFGWPEKDRGFSAKMQRITLSGLVLGLLLFVLIILAGSLYYGRWQFMARQDSEQQGSAQGLKQPSAVKTELNHKEQSGVDLAGLVIVKAHGVKPELSHKEKSGQAAAKEDL